jgi:hypothetical protein
MSQCSSYGMVRITDLNRGDVLRYLILCDGMFFGGNTWTRTDGFAPGVHVMMTLSGMLDLIGTIANAPRETHEEYYLESHGGFAVIRREMNAPELAKILGCDEQVVRDHFAPLISLGSTGNEG